MGTAIAMPVAFEIYTSSQTFAHSKVVGSEGSFG